MQSVKHAISHENYQGMYVSEKKPKIITIRVSEDLHKRADRRRFEQATSFQTILEAALASFADGAQSQAPVASHQNKSESSYPYPRHREMHDMLEYILANDKKAADWISGNLRMFAEALEGRAAIAGNKAADPHKQRRVG